MSGSFKISNCDRCIDRCVLFETIIRINAASWCSVYSRAVFINISALKCGVYSRAAFDRINTVYLYWQFSLNAVMISSTKVSGCPEYRLSARHTRDNVHDMTDGLRCKRHLAEDCTIIMSRTLKITGNHVMYDRGA